MKGKVSVLLTSYNRPHYLRQAVESVIAQTYENWELWIADDNSEQPTLDVITEFMAKEPRIKLYSSLRTERKPVPCPYAENINTVIKVSDGEFITYLTDDDFYYPARLEKMVAYLDAHPEVSVVCGWQQKIKTVDGKDQNWEVRKYGGTIIKGAAFTVDHNSVMHRRTCLEKTGLWPLHDVRCADAAFWRTMNAKGFDFHVISEVLDAKRYHNNTLSAKLDRRESIFENLE